MAHDLDALVPKIVRVAFPDAAKDVTLLSLALPQYGSIAGFVGVKTFHVGYEPETDAELDAYAIRMATDWYLWQLGRADIRYEGVCAWTMEGHSEIVEFEHTEDRISTRVSRGPWLDYIDDIYPATTEDDGDGSGVCNTTLAALQTTDCLRAVSSLGDEVILEYGVGVWTSVEDIDYPLGTGELVFSFANGALHLTLDGDELLWCGTNCFTGGPLTGHDDPFGAGDCAGAVFTICLTCEACPPPPDCPGCTDVPFIWTIVESGFTGSLTDYNGTWTLEMTEDCYWTVTVDDIIVTVTVDDDPESPNYQKVITTFEGSAGGDVTYITAVAVAPDCCEPVEMDQDGMNPDAPATTESEPDCGIPIGPCSLPKTLSVTSTPSAPGTNCDGATGSGTLTYDVGDEQWEGTLTTGVGSLDIVVYLDVLGDGQIHVINGGMGTCDFSELIASPGDVCTGGEMVMAVNPPNACCGVEAEDGFHITITW